MLGNSKNKIIFTGERSLCVKEFYKGYEISTVLEKGESGEFYCQDIRVYKNNIDLTKHFGGLFRAELTYIDYTDKNYYFIKRIIDALVVTK